LQALPESLRYLLAAGQNEKAADVLKRMAAASGKELPPGQLTASAEVRTVYLHTHTRLNGPLSGTTQVSRYQKGKTNLDFTGA